MEKEITYFHYYWKNPDNLDLNNKLKQEEGGKRIGQVRHHQLFSLSDHVSAISYLFLFLFAGGEDPGKLSHAMLKNGHTTHIGSTRSSSPVPIEEEPVRISSLRDPITDEEDPKKQLGNTGLFVTFYFLNFYLYICLFVCLRLGLTL